MKKLFYIGLVLSLLLCFIPVQAFAAVNDAELQPYLEELGWTKEKLDSYMIENYESSIEDFDSFTELKDFLGDILTEDRLTQLLAENNLTKEELKSQLVEYGDMQENEEILEAFPFYEDLAGLIEYYSEMTPINDENLAKFLTEYELTKEELNQLLADNQESLAEYRFIEELEWSVELYLENASKTPISDAELAKLVEKYDLTMEELEALLLENDDSLDNYTYIEDLEMALDFYLNYDMEIPGLEDLGITEEEIEKVMTYFESFDFEDPAFIEKVTALEEKYSFLEDLDVENVEEITEEQITQIKMLYQDILDLFNIEIKFALSKAGKITPVSLEEMMEMDSTNGADLIIEIYTKSGELLVDMNFPYDLMAEYEEDVTPAETVVDEVKDEVIQVAKLVQKKENKTINGAKLPKTASNMGLNIFIGLIMVVFGAWVVRKTTSKGA